MKIEGITMNRTLPGIDYTLLNEPLIRISWKNSINNFHDEEAYTDQRLAALGKIRAQEIALIDKFNLAIKNLLILYKQWYRVQIEHLLRPHHLGTRRPGVIFIK